MPKGYFLLSHDLLRDVLCLPDDADILAVEYISPITCKVWVAHNLIPNSEEGEARELLPVFQREGDQVLMIEWDTDIPLATLDVMEGGK